MKLPTTVPLPEVPRHTENIVFGALDLPVGFDQARLLVNVRQLERIRSVAGWASITVVKQTATTESFEPMVSGHNAEQGTAAFGLIGKRKKMPLATSSVSYDGSILGDAAKPAVVVEVDTGEVDRRIGEKREQFPKGQFEASAQARYLNGAIRAGLSEASFMTNVSRERLKNTAVLHGSLAVVCTLMDNPVVIVPVAGTLASYFATGLYPSLHGKNKEERMAILRQHRMSLFNSYGVTPDRWLATSALLAASHRPIKAV